MRVNTHLCSAIRLIGRHTAFLNLFTYLVTYATRKVARNSVFVFVVNTDLHSNLTFCRSLKVSSFFCESYYCVLLSRDGYKILRQSWTWLGSIRGSGWVGSGHIILRLGWVALGCNLYARNSSTIIPNDKKL